MAKKRRNLKTGEKNKKYISNFSIKKERKVLLHLHAPEVKMRMNAICNIIENSLKKGKDFDKIAERLLEGSLYSSFLRCYIDEYNARMRYANASMSSMSDFRKFKLLEDVEALRKFYDDFLERKNKSNINEEKNDDRDDLE